MEEVFFYKFWEYTEKGKFLYICIEILTRFTEICMFYTEKRVYQRVIIL